MRSTVRCQSAWVQAQKNENNDISFFCVPLRYTIYLAMSVPASSYPLTDRLDSWKEIAAYLGREVRTVQGWEKTEGLPVHRHQHARQGSVYAFKSELDSWREARRSTPEAANVTAIPETPIPETAIPPTDLGPKIP